nr:unnamed protein product [Meloidogyne enterolobii]
MKINFKHYLMYMFSTVLIVSLLHNLISIRYVQQYIEGGIKQAYKEYFNKTVPFVIMKLEQGLPSLITTLFVLISYLIIFVCGFKMVSYVKSHTGYDQNMKRLLKQLTKTLIILVIIPFINQLLPILIVFSTLNKTNDSVKDNYINPIYIFLAMFTHFTPVFNPIVCIITNKPYKEAVFNRLQIHPQ